MLPFIKSNLSLSPSQFGYRESTSTVLATAVLKETVGKYLAEDSSVYACFLDLSKAFERVRHELIREKMHLKGIPSSVVRTFAFIFANSNICVSYGTSFSTSWTAGRGVRQGGVVSAYLFCLYIDDILCAIDKHPYGCWLGIRKLNIQA